MRIGYDALGSPLTVNFNGTTYFYAVNLQGDVIAILDAEGNAVVTYSYDAWGNPTGGTRSSTDPNANALYQYNPLRYRGYVYDFETGFYYLQSRYYNPQTGRFLNADGYTSTGQGILGNNAFAYCLNNPVNMYDNTGYVPEWINNAIKTVGGFITKVKATADAPATVTKIAIASGVALISGQASFDDIKTDIKNYKFYNSDSQKCLDAKVFSSYNGTPVIKQDLSGGSMSICNTIFLGKSERETDAVKHEWGHTVQQSMLGTHSFLPKFALPSLLGTVFTSNEKYFSQPWECSADFFGGANYGPYATGAEWQSSLYFLLAAII